VRSKSVSKGPLKKLMLLGSAAAPNLATDFIAWDRAWVADGQRCRSLAITDGAAHGQFPNEVNTTQGYVDGSKLLLSGNGAAVNGDGAKTPDSASHPTSDATGIVYVTASDWTTGAARELFSKWNTTGNQRGFRFFFHTTDVLRFQYSTDGSSGTNVTVTASAAPTVVDGTGYYLAWTRNATTGDVKFWQAAGTGLEDDPAALSFTQIGTTQTTAAGAMFDSTASLTIAGTDPILGTNSFVGSCHRAQLRSGATIASSTLVADFRPYGQAAGAGSWLSTTGERWTVVSNQDLRVYTTSLMPLYIASSPEMNGLPVFRLDGVDDYLRALLAYGSEQPLSIIVLGRYRSAPAAVSRVVGTNSTGAHGIGAAANGNYSMAQANVVTGSTAVPTTPIMLRHEQEASGGTSKLFANEVEVASGDLGAITFDRFVLGLAADATSPAAFDVYGAFVLKDGPVTARTGWSAFKQAASGRVGTVVG
jgi:hypothetical protein